MKRIYVVKLGDSFSSIRDAQGDFEHWTQREMAAPAEVADPRGGAPLPQPEVVAGAVLTGSHAMVTDREPWSEATAEWLRELVRREVPVLGICFGHQLLAHAHGAEVGYRPGGTRLGTLEVRLLEAAASDPLLGGLPPVFPAQVSHSQAVLRLPCGAVPLAADAAGGHYAFRLGARAWGLQFHPEFSVQVMRGYIRENAGRLRAAGRDSVALEQAVLRTPEATSLLRRFVTLAAA
ncbi:MAG: glutamine amidotransferase [Ectothiorhodospiraceae bacterium]|nr:glutamine amidotransferase [Ectothiorhodospiraceae bacterium]